MAVEATATCFYEPAASVFSAIAVYNHGGRYKIIASCTYCQERIIAPPQPQLLPGKIIYTVRFARQDNPVTKQPYTSADILMETNKLFKDLDHTQLHDLTPVDEQQATDLLHKYYTERYGTEEGTRKERDDIKKRKAKPLRPGTPESSQYRPRYSSKGVLQMSGPELFDIAGVDDAPSKPHHARRKRTRVKRN